MKKRRRRRPYVSRGVLVYSDVAVPARRYLDLVLKQTFFAHFPHMRKWPMWKCEEAIRRSNDEAKREKKNSESLEEMREDVSRDCDAQQWSHSHKMWCQGRQLINCFLSIHLVARWHLVCVRFLKVGVVGISAEKKKRISNSLKSIQSLFDGTPFDVSPKKTVGTNSTKQIGRNDENNQTEWIIQYEIGICRRFWWMWALHMKNL